MSPAENELSVIQRMYDLIKWYVPRAQKFPQSHKFVLGERIQRQLYDLLEGLIRAKYQREKTALLETLNVELDVLRFQTRLCLEFDLLDRRRHEHVSELIQAVGVELGGWLRQQRKRA